VEGLHAVGVLQLKDKYLSLCSITCCVYVHVLYLMNIACICCDIMGFSCECCMYSFIDISALIYVLIIVNSSKSLYGRSNYLLFVLNSLEMHTYMYIYMYVPLWCCPTCWSVVGDVTNWYQRSKGKVKIVWVALPDKGWWSGMLQYHTYFHTLGTPLFFPPLQHLGT
jgi:hypothetical protein